MIENLGQHWEVIKGGVLLALVIMGMRIASRL
ncbi:hypothetical protein JBW_01554 [Pelosinus fermentans JBW45]|uniref:Uncharacterized protein n=1 Tax=Pelosinus fermentans JBW45 TaxID=1192197 RepID=I8TUL3_9FIRM|nr:hypothetical protein JBW_01554 [Pelosinus fermentans JBW45]